MRAASEEFPSPRLARGSQCSRNFAYPGPEIPLSAGIAAWIRVALPKGNAFPRDVSFSRERGKAVGGRGERLRRRHCR